MADPRLVRPLWRGRTNVDALTVACIEHAEQIVRDEHPAIAHDFVCTQGSYQGGSGDPLSAGTHDLGGVVDLAWCGHDVCILALRRAGTTASHRTPAQGPWPDHIHLVVIDHPYLAPVAARQVSAYLAGRNGLADNGPDDGPRLNPIPRPVWPWPQEDDMSEYAEQLDRIENGVKALRKKTADRHQTTIRAIRKGFDEIADAVADDATKGQVARVALLLDELAGELAAEDEA